MSRPDWIPYGTQMRLLRVNANHYLVYVVLLPLYIHTHTHNDDNNNKRRKIVIGSEWFLRSSV